MTDIEKELVTTLLQHHKDSASQEQFIRKRVRMELLAWGIALSIGTLAGVFAAYFAVIPRTVESAVESRLDHTGTAEKFEAAEKRIGEIHSDAAVLLGALGERKRHLAGKHAEIDDALADAEKLNTRVTGLEGQAAELSATLSELRTSPPVEIGAQLEALRKWSQQEGVQLTSTVVPTGVVVPFVGTIAPPGWALCDGSQLKRDEAPALFDFLRVIAQSASKTTVFTDYDTRTESVRLPDLRGYFVRGTGGQGGGALGELQEDQLQEHKHKRTVHNNSGGGGLRVADAGKVVGDDNHVWESDHPYGWRRQEIAEGRVGSETRPRNVSLWYIIKK